MVIAAAGINNQEVAGVYSACIIIELYFGLCPSSTVQLSARNCSYEEYYL